MNYYIIAGEASGDLHGANLMKALTVEDTNANFRVWGGDLMQAAGGDLRKHYRDFAYMGFLEVAKNIRTIYNNLRFCQRDILAFQPDVLILIDYPGFNLRIAKWAKRRGIKVFYYISPQIWAWHSSRVHNIKRTVDKMFVILPFEEAFYQKYGMRVDFVGHPLLDVVRVFEKDDEFRDKYQLGDKPIIALLPGSRKQEIRRMLGEMLQMVSKFADYQFVVAGAPSQEASFYQHILQQNGVDIPIVNNDTYQLLAHSKAALVTSGTATLETALFKVPQVVCYQGNQLSYWIAKRLVNVEYISLVNLILNRPLVKELIQDEFNEKALTVALQSLLLKENADHFNTGYQELADTLGHSGASQRAAQLMVGYL